MAMFIAIPSDGVLLAIIGSFTTLTGQIITGILAKKRSTRDMRQRQELGAKVDLHSSELKKELEVNTKITQATSHKADKAYSEANNFNSRLHRVETELRDDVLAELRRLSHNIHAVANALMPFVGVIEMEKRKTSTDDNKEG